MDFSEYVQANQRTHGATHLAYTRACETPTIRHEHVWVFNIKIALSENHTTKPTSEEAEETISD